MESLEFETAVKKYAPVLVEVRKRLVLALVVFGVGVMGGFLLYERIIEFLIGLLSLKGVNIVFTSPFQFINLAVSCGIATGIVVALPLFVVQVWSFLLPALRKKEYSLVGKLSLLSIGLFLCGFAFGVLVMKWQIGVFLAQSVALGIGNMLDISKLLSTVLLTAVLMGMGFQFPLVLFILMRIGLLEHHQVSRKRLWVYLGVFIFSMLLPSDAIVTDVFLSLPMIVLFELTLLMGKKHHAD